MTDLSPEDLSPTARALLDAGNDGLAPSAATKAKVLAAVEGSIASGSVGSSASGMSAGKLLLVLVLAAGAIGGLWLYLGDGPKTVATQARDSIASEAAPDTAQANPGEASEDAPAYDPALAYDSVDPEDDAKADAEEARIAQAEADRLAEAEAAEAKARIVEARVAEVRAQHGKKEERVAAPSADTLLAERRLMAAAQIAIRSKDYAEARRILSRHMRQYPQGILSPERDAAKAIALCLDPDEGDGPAAAKRFLADHASSPLAQRVKMSCDLN